MKMYIYYIHKLYLYIYIYPTVYIYILLLYYIIIYLYAQPNFIIFFCFWVDGVSCVPLSPLPSRTKCEALAQNGHPQINRYKYSFVCL